MDDTTCINQFDFPLLTLSFEDYNKIRQILAFGFIPGRETKHFSNFLNDIKQFHIYNIRVFIVDRWRPQSKAIKTVFPESEIVFCKIHLYRNIRTSFGEYSMIGSLFIQFMNLKITEEQYINEIQKIIPKTKKHHFLLTHLIDDIKSYSPYYLNKLQLRSHRTTNPQEGLFGTLKQRCGNKIYSLLIIFEVMKDIYISGIMKSMSFFPKTFDIKIFNSAKKQIGELAFNMLKKEYEKAKEINNLIFSNNEEDIQRFRNIINEECKCQIKNEYGLICFHDILQRIKENEYPLIPVDSIPEIYYVQEINEESDIGNEDATSFNIEDENNDELIDFSYTNLMAKFSKVASHAKKNPQIQKNIKLLFDNIKSINIGEGKDPLTIHEKGRKTVRPSNKVTNSGARKRKRKYCCRNCGSPNHNSKTCKYKKKDDSFKNDEREDDEDVIEIIDTGVNKKAESNEDYSDDDIKECKNEDIDDFSDDNIKGSNDKSDDNSTDFSDDNDDGNNGEKNDNNNDFVNDNDDDIDMYNDFSDIEYDVRNAIKNRNKLMKLLSETQLNILDTYPIFEKFLWQIVEIKDASDRPTINGVYHTQYSDVKNSISRRIFDEKESEIIAIKLIYEMNFEMEIPPDMIEDILIMCRKFDRQYSSDESE